MWRNTVLLNRSKEERENIISEKVAALLASEDTQRNEWTGPGNGCRNGPLLRYKDKVSIRFTCKKTKEAVADPGKETPLSASKKVQYAMNR